jgi:SAM-dependent methyltransferase
VYLKDLCRRLTVVDLSPVCIENCRKRFADCSQIAYAVNDGKSLAMIPDRSLDFAFSFDSLVHAEADVLEAYVGELAKKLKPNGVALVHHSNALRYQRHFAWVARLPRGRGFLARQGLLIDDCGRAHSMSALLFETYCRQAGVCCVSQEIINWSGRHLIDCISVFTPKGSIWERPNRVLENPGFVAEARRTAALAPLYTQAGFPGLRHPPAA